MATQHPGMLLARESAVDLTGKEYFFAVVDSAGKFDIAGLGAQAIGSIQEGKAAGLHSTVMTSGVAKIVAGGAVAAGASVSSTALGKAKVVAITENICGIALTGAAADGEIIEVHLAVAGIL